jgi:protein-S-isoprenylcysteine O-methyltransferase Ste14
MAIEVPQTAASAIVATSIGQAVQALGGIAIAYGVLTPQHEIAIVAAVPMLVTACWRIYRAIRDHLKSVVMADAAPDDVAKVIRK